jgi:type I restriction enzyme S subunit
VEHLKRAMRLQYGDALAVDARRPGEVPVFGSNGPVGNHDQANTTAPAILVGRKGSCGALTWTDEPGFAIDTVYYVDRSTTPADLRWAFWVLHPLGLSGLSQDTGVPGLSREAAYEQRLPVPPPAEQAAIAAFLDRETGKIDALVEEQRRLIALLKEKRQAVISHAVTKGLNPQAPLKPSGIDWLGDIPAHWEVRPLRYVGSAIIGLTYTPEDVVGPDEGTLVLRSSNVQNGKITLDDNVFVARDIPDHLQVREGDILICSRNGSRELIGKNAKIGPEHDGMTFGAFMTVFRTDMQGFIHWVLNSPIFKFQSSAFLTSTINQLTVGNLNSFAVPLPPDGERCEISAFLEAETAKIDDLVSEAERGITLLHERRAALISAAVTGKIDVRHVGAFLKHDRSNQPTHAELSTH